MQKIKYLFLFFSVFTIYLSASERPRWITETPAGFRNDYYVGFAESNVLEEAKLLSEENAKSQIRGKQSGINFSTQKVAEQYIEQEQNLYRVWTLVSFPKALEEQTSPPTKFSPVWRSAILPSWGQFYKGESTKGYFIAGGTAVFLTSGFVFSNLKITSESNAKNSRTQVLRDFYNDEANTYNNISLACFIASAAVYIYNVVDATAADGEKVYVFNTPQNNVILPVKNLYPIPSTLLSFGFGF